MRLRKDRGLTQGRVAANLEWSASKLIRVEGGHTSITKVDLDALLGQYGVTSENQRERLHALNRAARERGWWEAFKGRGLSETYLTYVGYEVGAAVIRQFQGSVVPGLLQTAEYARALTTYAIEAVQVASVVELRLRRQSYLAQRSSPPDQYYFIDEAIIRRHIGIQADPAIMPNQLLHIAERAEREEFLDVRIIPFRAGAHAGLAGPFTLLEFEGGLDDILYLDGGREMIAMKKSDPEVPEYAENFESFSADALSAQDSIALLRDAAEDLG
ncbi:MAG: Scr1 family TA system antitoxin-like transcriptional regulator [Streptosporangiaceae bacterium]